MEMNNTVVVPDHYNSNQLVTYKVIDGETVSFPTEKVTSIEYALQQARNVDRQLAALRLTVSQLEDKLPEWIENETDTATIVAEICELFSFNPTKEIEFEALVRITGTVDVPLAEIATFDINDVDLNIDINSYSHNVNTYDYGVESIDTL